MYCFERKLLRVNLSDRKAEIDSIPHEVVMSFVGGRGFGIKYLYEELSPGIDPLSSQNKLVFITGPLAGSGAHSLSKWMVATKSPLTGTYTRSVCGSAFGALMRFAGFDLIIVEGRSEEPVYIYIEQDKVEIFSAQDIWGMDTARVQDKLKEVHGRGVRIACIGPAGERLVRFASILGERRIAARGGVGAVMGSKNLKAVVINSSRKEFLTDSEKFKKLIEKQVSTYKNSSPPLFEPFSEMGTTMITESMHDRGIFPVRNFREGNLGEIENITAESYARIKVRNSGCYGCLVHCGNIFKMGGGLYAGATNEGPEYESIWAFTGPMVNSDIGATVIADSLCDDFGMDTISCGNTIGFAFELFDKGMLTTKHTDGLELTYGNHKVMIELIKKIGKREGFGDLLAEGTLRAARKIGNGAEQYAMQVKGQEMPAYEPRAVKGQGLGIATCNFGANHNPGYFVQEVFNVPIPRPVEPFAEEGKGDILKINQDLTAFYEVLIACAFTAGFGWMPVPDMCEMLVTATGVKEFGDPESMLRVGERINNLERAFNVREGFSRKDDMLPDRFLTEPLRNAGPAEGQVYKKYNTLLDEYYQHRGWTKEGTPTPEKLRELGLENIIEDLKKPMKGIDALQIKK